MGVSLHGILLECSFNVWLMYLTGSLFSVSRADTTALLSQLNWKYIILPVVSCTALC